MDAKRTADRTLCYRRDRQMEFKPWLAGPVDFCVAFLCLRRRKGSFSGDNPDRAKSTRAESKPTFHFVCSLFGSWERLVL